MHHRGPGNSCQGLLDHLLLSGGPRWQGRKCLQRPAAEAWLQRSLPTRRLQRSLPTRRLSCWWHRARSCLCTPEGPKHCSLESLRAPQLGSQGSAAGLACTAEIVAAPLVEPSYGRPCGAGLGGGGLCTSLLCAPCCVRLYVRLVKLGREGLEEGCFLCLLRPGTCAGGCSSTMGSNELWAGQRMSW
jgi:hypothetical protein